MKLFFYSTLLPILAYATISLSMFDLTDNDQPEADSKVIIQQLIDETYKETKNIQRHVKNTQEDLKKLNRQIKTTDKNLDDLDDNIDNLDDTVDEFKEGILPIRDKICTIESLIDEVADQGDSLQDIANASLSSLEDMSFRMDAINDAAESNLDKICDALSIAEIIEDNISSIQNLANSIVDTTETTISIIEDIDSKSDLILSKLCNLESDFDTFISLVDNTSIILSAIDVIESNTDELQTTFDSILDKTCMILTNVEEIDSQVDELLPIATSTFDKTCDILSISEDIASKYDVLESVEDIIESKVCLLSTCDFTITQADVGAGGIYTISAPGVYCLVENVTFNTGAAITIDGTRDVYLQMGGHTIDGGGNVPAQAIVISGSVNVHVNYGFITGSSVGILATNSDPIVIDDIKISNGPVITDANSLPGTVGGIVADNTNQMVVTNCHCTRVSPVGFHARNGSSGCVFRNCTAHQMTHAGFVADSTTTGCVFDSCSAFGNTTNEISHLFINNFNSTPPFTTHLIIGGPAFGLYGNGGYIQSCIACQYTFQNRLDGIVTAAINGAFDTNGFDHVLLDCVSVHNAAHGFALAGRGLTVKRCIGTFTQNFNANNVAVGHTGFQLSRQPITRLNATLLPAPLFSSLVYDCVGTNNFRGFQFVELARDNELRRSIAINNSNDGVHLFPQIPDGPLRNQLLSNIATNNGLFGFRHNPILNENRFYNNFACDNAVINYFDPGTIEGVQVPTDLASYWINADCNPSLVLATNFETTFEQLIADIYASLLDLIATGT